MSYIFHYKQRVGAQHAALPFAKVEFVKRIFFGIYENGFRSHLVEHQAIVVIWLSIKLKQGRRVIRHGLPYFQIRGAHDFAPVLERVCSQKSVSEHMKARPP